MCRSIGKVNHGRSASRALSRRGSVRSKQDQCVKEERIVVRVLVIERVLQAEARVQPWPERRPTVHERDICNLGGPAAVARTAGRSVKYRISRTAERKAVGREAPCVVEDIRSGEMQAVQKVVRIVGEPKRPARL